jgi:hypothetical protein
MMMSVGLSSSSIGAKKKKEKKMMTNVNLLLSFLGA